MDEYVDKESTSQRNRFYFDLNTGLVSSAQTQITHIRALAQSIYEQPKAYWPVCSSPFQ